MINIFMVYSIDHREDIKEISVSEEKEEEIRESYNRMKDRKATLPSGEEHKAVKLEPKEEVDYKHFSLHKEHIFNHISSGMSPQKKMKSAFVRDELNDEEISVYALEDVFIITSDGMPEYETFRDYILFLEHNCSTELKPKYTRGEKIKEFIIGHLA